MEISIAGAGAGKTTTMANKIIQLHLKMNEYLKIFCITFTNNATKCISEKLQAHYGYIPDNIIVSTIHSFFYQEFIKPYYFLLFGKQYERISTAELPSRNVYKNSVIKRLENKNILHQVVIPERAKWVIVKKSNDNKNIKAKRLVIRNIFKSYCGAICIDEAQDIDNNMSEVIELLHNLGIPIILMGDPKQDLKGHGCLRNLAEKYSDKVEYLKFCYRCPQNHLILSNSIISDIEKQYSKKNGGLIKVYFSSDKNIYDLLYERNFDLKYISRKQGIYETHINKKNKNIKEAICEEIYIAIKNNYINKSEIELMRYSYYLSEKLLYSYKFLKDKKKAMMYTLRDVSLKDKKAYGRIISLIIEENDDDKNKMVYVNSIDSIKGQEGKYCLLILTTDLAAYLFGKKTEENICKNRLYVGLTRSLEVLIIFITPEVEEIYGKEKIKSFFYKYGCL